MKIIDYLLGGRPMTKIANKKGFWDRVACREVHYWKDKFGRMFMATDRWGWFRVKIEEQPNE